MATRTITIGDPPSKKKDSYNIIIERGVDDLVWMGPAKSTGIEILYDYPNVVSSGSFATPSAKNLKKWTFYARDHGKALVKVASAGGGVEIQYKIIVHWPAPKKDDVIDPFVKILP